MLGAGVFSVRVAERGSRTTATTIPTAIATTTTSPAVTQRVLTITFVTVPRRHKRLASIRYEQAGNSSTSLPASVGDCGQCQVSVPLRRFATKPGPRGKLMVDPISLVALSSMALGEGIKFLYTQTGELLKAWREKRARQDEAALKVAPASERLDAPLQPAEVDQSLVAEHADELSELRRMLVQYADEGKQPNPKDQELLARVDALRRVLELLLGQRITFRGEGRERTGTRIQSTVEAGTIRGYVAAVRASGLIGDVDVNATLKTGDIEQTGVAVGVDLSRQRPSPS
jgi:hypothetical protein